MKLIQSIFAIICSACLMLNMAFAADNTTSNTTSTMATQAANKHEGIDITVNVNTASAEEIAAMLNGIGTKRAQDIVDYRDEHGNFKSIEDLIHVKGIGEATVNKNRERITL